MASGTDAPRRPPENQLFGNGVASVETVTCAMQRQLGNVSGRDKRPTRDCGNDLSKNPIIGVCICDGGAPLPGHARQNVVIELVQPTGSRTYITFPLGGQAVVAEVAAPLRLPFRAAARSK